MKAMFGKEGQKRGYKNVVTPGPEATVKADQDIHDSDRPDVYPGCRMDQEDDARRAGKYKRSASQHGMAY